MADVLCLSKVYHYKINNKVKTYDIDLSFDKLIKDYPQLNVNPKLNENPSRRNKEFKATVIRWLDNKKDNRNF